MQPLEDGENAIGKFRFDTNPIVLDGKQPFPCLLNRFHMNLRRFITVELDGVSHKVLKELSQLRMVPGNLWEDAPCHDGATFLDARFETGEGLIQCYRAIDLFERLLFFSNAGKGQDVIDELVHPRGAIQDEAEILVCFVVELPTVIPGQDIREV